MSIDTKVVLVGVGSTLALAGGLVAILTPYFVLALVMCVIGLVCVLACFYIT